MDSIIFQQLIQYQFDPILSEAACTFTEFTDLGQLTDWISQNESKKEFWKQKLSQEKKKKLSKMDIEELKDPKEDKIIDEIISQMFSNQTYQNLINLSMSPILSAAAMKFTKVKDEGTLCQWINQQINNEQKWRKWLIQKHQKKPQLDLNMFNALLQKNSLGLPQPKNIPQPQFNPNIQPYEQSEKIKKQKQKIIDRFLAIGQYRKNNMNQIKKNRAEFLKNKYKTDNLAEAIRLNEQVVKAQWYEHFVKRTQKLKQIQQKHPELTYADVFGGSAKPETLIMLGDQLIDSNGDDLTKPPKYRQTEALVAKLKAKYPRQEPPSNPDYELPKMQEMQEMQEMQQQDEGDESGIQLPFKLENIVPSKSSLLTNYIPISKPTLNLNYNDNLISFQNPNPTPIINPVKRTQKYKENSQDIMEETQKLPPSLTLIQQNKFMSLKKRCESFMQKNTKDKAQKFFQTTIACIQKIIEDFQNPKYRKINKSNPNTIQKLLNCQYHMEVLQHIGFQDNQQFLIMKPEAKTIHDLQEIKKILDRYLNFRRRG